MAAFIFFSFCLIIGKNEDMVCVGVCDGGEMQKEGFLYKPKGVCMYV